MSAAATLAPTAAATTRTAASTTSARPTLRRRSSPSERRSPSDTSTTTTVAPTSVDDAEDLSVRHPVGVRREVLRQARARERPTRDDERRTGSREQEQPAPHTFLA